MVPGLETPLVLVLVAVTDLPSLSGTSDPYRKGLSPFQRRAIKGLGQEDT